MLTRLLSWTKENKLKVIFLAVVIGGGWYYFRGNSASSQVTKYVLGQVERGNIITTVSGSGQVASTNQIDIKPTVSAEIKDIKVIAGQKVKKGDLLVILDSKDLAKQARQAADSLSLAKANLDLKLAGPTAQDIVVSQKQVDSALLSYNSSKNNLENAKLANEENLRKAQVALDNARISLDSAQRSYDNSLTSGNLTESNSSQSLINAYSNAESTVNTTLITLRAALVAADGILGIDSSPVNSNLKNVLSIKNSSYLNDANNQYVEAKGALNNLNSAVAAAGTGWSPQTIDDLLNKSLTVSKSISSLEISTHNALLNTITSSDVSQANLDSYKSSIANQVSAVNSAQNSIQSTQQNIIKAKSDISSTDLSSNSNVSAAKSALSTAQNNLVSAQSSLNQSKLDAKKNLDTATADVESKKNSYESAKAQFDLKVAKPRAIDLASLHVQVRQAEESLQEAKDNLADAQVKSPIEGTVAKIYQKVGDVAGQTTILITVITPKQLATVALNEVDVAKVKTGQKATLTFSAIDGLEITGEVADIDALGTVSSGVVSYNVNIAFDTQDDRIKPQMSASAAIVTAEKINVLSVANSAVKTDASQQSYVEELANPSQPDTNGQVTSAEAPTKKNIEIGVANDTNTEVLSGLQEGEKVITRTVAGATTATTQQSGLSLFGGGNRNGAARGIGR